MVPIRYDYIKSITTDLQFIFIVSCLCRYRISATPQVGKGTIQQESTEGRRKTQSPLPNIVTGGISQPYSAFRPKEHCFPFHRDVVQVKGIMSYLAILLK